jgi:hypothetical protein
LRSKAYVALWIVGLTIGWFEGSVVIYLRALFYPGGFAFPIVEMPMNLLGVEIAREACSLILLGAIGYLAGTRRADRWGAFLLLFGIWDLTYYVVLKIVLGWPAGLDVGTWDVLFLIPLPWAAPLWAPALVAAEFVAIGTYLVFTRDRPRAYRPLDVAILVVAALIIVGSFLAEWRTVAEARVPEHFPVAVFAFGALLGTGWLIATERAMRGTPVRR